MSTTKLSPFGNAVSGAASSLIANILVFPLDVIKARLQVQSPRFSSLADTYTGTLDAFIQILQKEGPQALYSGLWVGSLGNIVSSFVYFYWYSLIRGYYSRKKNGVQGISTTMELVLGALGGVISQVTVLPMSVITTRQQTSPSGKKLTWNEACQQILKEDGVTGFWKGLIPSIILCVNPAVTFGTYTTLQKLLLRRNPGQKFLTPAQAFVLGMIAKTLATVICYPYIMAKVRMQWRVPEGMEKERDRLRQQGAWDVLKDVYREEGFFGLYHGLQAQVQKATLAQAIVFVIKERLTLWTLLAMRAMEIRIQKQTTYEAGLVPLDKLDKEHNQ